MNRHKFDEGEYCEHLLLARERHLVDKRNGRPFREPETPHENLMMGIVFSVLIVAVTLFILAGAR